SIGFLHAKQGKLDDAERDFREALTGYLAKFGEGSVETADARHALGNVLRDEIHYSEAEPILLQAESALASQLPAAAASHAKCAQDLVKLYESWEQAEPGKDYAAKAEQWRSKQ